MRSTSFVLRRFTTAATLTAIVAAASVVIAAPASAVNPSQDITSLTTTLPAMHPGQTAWLSTLWQGANKDADSFRMTATSTGASISYPTNTGSYSSLWGSSTLSASATDFAALKVTVNDSVTQAITITLTVNYDLHQNNGNSNTTPEAQTLQVSLPVTVVGGPAITTLTAALGPVANGTSSWQQFSVRGEKPGVTSLTAQVSAPAGITIAYPAATSDTSPSQSSTLNVGTTDYFAFQVTVGSSVVAGSYNLTVTMTYGSAQTQTAVVPLSVT
jgi:hypothetical protein